MKDVRVFFACFFGALIGGIIAREAGSGFWWLGSIAGFVVGYLSYEFKEVLEGVHKAWKKTINIGVAGILKTAASFLYVLFMAIAFALMFFGFLIGFIIAWGSLVSGSFINTLISSVISATMGYIVLLMEGDYKDRGKLIIIFANPVVFACYWLPKGVFLFLKNISAILKSTSNFLVLTFRYIHSDVRLLCGVDAAIGAGVGYFTGDMLLGALFGGLFGLLNYRVVRTYIFKISPQKS